MKNKKIMNEIGGEFWFDPQVATGDRGGLPVFLAEKFSPKNHDYFFTSSGRSACLLLLNHVQPKKKSVMLPECTCETVITPFVHAGYDLHFYEVELDLDIDIEKWLLQYQNTQPGIVLLHPYFGFDTIACVREKYDEIKSDGCIVIEDITHSLLSRFPIPVEPDYYLSSLRKWTGIPDGGVLIDCSKNVPITPPNEHDVFFVSTRMEAFALKNLFMKDENSDGKDIFLSIFAKAEDHLNHTTEPTAMSEISSSIIANTDWNEIFQQRRENYLFLEKRIKDFDDLLYPVMDSLPESFCPLFMPVWVNRERDSLRNHLICHRIYPPIHWPIPQHYVQNKLRVHEFYHHCLSIPCDQRYDEACMSRIIDLFAAWRNV